MSAKENVICHSGAPHGGEPGVYCTPCGANLDSGFFALRSPGMTAAISVFSLLFAFPAPAFAQQADNPIPNSGGALIMPKDALPDPLQAGWKGEKVCEVLQENENLRALKCAFPPGVGHERHYHAPHFGYVLAGGKMQIADKTGIVERDLKTGTSWKSDGVDWHEAVNIGDATAIYLIVEPKVME